MASGQDMGRLAQAAEQLKNKPSVQQLLQSSDARHLMDMLGRQGGVQDAARAAAAGDPAQLMDMMHKLMDSPEGAQLVERITKQAEKSGLS